MKETWHERTEREIAEVRARVEFSVRDGMTPTDAINRHAHTAETYTAMLKDYNLKPVIPD